MTVFIERTRFKKHFHKFKCQSVDKVEVVRVINANGITQYRLRCCTLHRPPMFAVSQKLLSQNEQNHAMLIQNNILKYANKPCARCGNPETERHHWAPRYLFKDSEDWPTGWLCLECHQYWHKIIKQSS
jgi:hypothetical protein